MKKNIDPGLIEYIDENWDNERNAQEVQDIIAAIVAQLNNECRDWQRRHGQDDECQAFFDGLIAEVQGPEFWQKLDHMVHFSFDY